MSPGKTEVKQEKFVKFISPAKGYFRETYKSQNIKHISVKSEHFQSLTSTKQRINVLLKDTVRLELLCVQEFSQQRFFTFISLCAD